MSGRPRIFAARSTNKALQAAFLAALRSKRPPPAFTFRLSGPGLVVRVEREGTPLVERGFAWDYFSEPSRAAQTVARLIDQAIERNRALFLSGESP
jgi:hypothetical protein